MDEGGELFIFSSLLVVLGPFIPARISFLRAKKELLNYLKENYTIRWTELVSTPMGSLPFYIWNNLDTKDQNIYRLKVRARWSFVVTLMTPFFLVLNVILFWSLGVLKYVGPR